MDILSVQSFLGYYKNIRSRTLKVAARIPPDRIDWTYKAGKFTLGDIVRHIAATERWLYAENVQNKPSRYAGCGKDLADGYDATLAYMKRTHEESIVIFSALTDEDLKKLCTTPAQVQVPIWKLLRAMVEHEIHHRGQLYTYLGMLDVATPPIFGMTSEEVIAQLPSR